jgi:hypothetical protein
MFIYLIVILSIIPSFAAEDMNYYVERKSYGTLRDTEPPRYVKPYRDWLDLGLDYRFRYEYRDNDFRRQKEVTDQPLLNRERLYVGIKNIFDPLRLGFELSNATRSNSHFAKDNRDVNEMEPIQAFGELYSKDLLGSERPTSLKFGRMAFEYLDRRLLSRNEWRNTTNTFEGLRMTLGQQKNDWQLDVLALRPLIRFQEKLDQPDYAQSFYGMIGDIRRWSRYTTLQPYYLVLKQDGSKVKYGSDGKRVSSGVDRNIQTAGLRSYGLIQKTPLDYDLDYVSQWGEDGNAKQDAKAYNLELGYSPIMNWAPRFSTHYGYASGDVNPNDKKQQRFEKLFGFSRPWSNNDYIQMENIRATKLRVEIEPIQTLKIDFGYSWYQLASATDRWAAANLRDKKGLSGKNIGEEFDIRARYPITSKIATQVGYAYFMGGNFAKKTSQAINPDRDAFSHFFYMEFSLSAF